MAGRTDKMATVWPLEPHTQAKHELLRHYLGAWYAILSKRRRVIVLDGFAGPGIYAGGEDGSPRIVMSTLLSHSFADGMGECEFLFLFNEQDLERYEVLEAEIGRLRSDVGGWPENVKVQHFNESFPVLAQTSTGVSYGILRGSGMSNTLRWSTRPVTPATTCSSALATSPA